LWRVRCHDENWGYQNVKQTAFESQLAARFDSNMDRIYCRVYDALGQNPYDKNRPLNPYEEIGKRLDKEDRERRLARPYTLTSPEPGSLNMDERISRWDVASKRLEELTKIEGRDALRIQEIRMMRPAWANPFSEKVLFAAEQLEKSSKKQGQWQVSWLEDLLKTMANH